MRLNDFVRRVIFARFSVSVTGTSENCLLTNYPFVNSNPRFHLLSGETEYTQQVPLALNTAISGPCINTGSHICMFCYQSDTFWPTLYSVHVMYYAVI